MTPVEQSVIALVETGLATCAVFLVVVIIGSLLGRRLRSVAPAPYTPVDIKLLGRLAAECDLNAQKFHDHPAERIKFEDLAAEYRKAQDLEIENRQRYLAR
jgi:hypothetical protein